MMHDPVTDFLDARPVAVVGATADRSKYGNIVLRNLRDRGWEVFAVNPRAREVEGQPAYRSLADCPQTPGLAVMLVPPAITLTILEEAATAGVERVWMQPGAGDARCSERAQELKLQSVNGLCIMVEADRHGR